MIEVLKIDEWLKRNKSYGINVVNEIEKILLKEIFLAIKQKK
jgi:hypothetical protein